MIVRPVCADDLRTVRRIFRETLVLGRPVVLAEDLLDRYESLCLGWYLGPGRADAAVVEDRGRVVGYALVCTDAEADRAWERREAARFVRFVVPRLMCRRWDRRTAQFCRLRLRDGLDLWRAGADPPARAHAHVNVVSGRRTGQAGRLLLDHVDARCRARGLTAWYGEINAPRGRRAAALDRLGVHVVRAHPNRTLSWLGGAPVDRLTVLRQVPLCSAVRRSVGRRRWKLVPRTTRRRARRSTPKTPLPAASSGT